MGNKSLDKNDKVVQNAGCCFLGVQSLRLVHCAIEIGFTEKSRLATPAERVLEAISGKGGKKMKRPLDPGVSVKDDDKKVDIRWQRGRLTIELEDLSVIGSCLEVILGWMERINAVAPIGNVRRTNVTMFWIYPAPKYDSISLERKYREVMVVKHEGVFEGVFDSSVLFDSVKDAGELHHQSGPMGIKQLKEGYLTFDISDVPDNFIFLWCGCKSGKMVEYSQEGMSKHLNNIFKCCKLHSDEFSKMWEEVI